MKNERMRVTATGEHAASRVYPFPVEKVLNHDNEGMWFVLAYNSKYNLTPAHYVGMVCQVSGGKHLMMGVEGNRLFSTVDQWREWEVVAELNADLALSWVSGTGEAAEFLQSDELWG